MSGERFWLLELDLGPIFRVSTEDLDVETESGAELRFVAGLAEPGVSLASVAGHEETSVRVELVTEDDWALFIAQGAPIEGRTAALYRWEEGTTFERAVLILRGTVRGVSYGAQGEALSFDIVRSLLERADVLPHPQAAIESTTWPITGSHSVPQGSNGTVYPLIIGSPGHGSGFAAVPVKYAQQNGTVTTNAYLVVSDGAIHAGTVRLVGRTAEGEQTVATNRTVSQVQDLLGRTVSVITPATVEDLEYFVGLADNATYGRGIRNRRNEALRGAGGVLRWVWEEHMDVRVDWGRTLAVLEQLDAYKIDAAILERTNLWEWAVQEVLPVLPIEIRESALGLYPALWRWHATKTDAVDHLDATRSRGRLVRSSAVGQQGDIYNEITVEYRPNPGGGFRNRRIATGKGLVTARQPAPNDDTRIRGSALLAMSQAAYGVRPLTIQAAAVWDHSTVELMLRDRIAAHAWPRRTVSYEGGPELEKRRVGDVVTLTDPELHFDEALALVWDLTPGTAPVIDLVLLDHPQRTERAI